MQLIYESGKLKGFEKGKDYSQDIIGFVKSYHNDFWGDMPDYRNDKVDNIKEANNVKISLFGGIKQVSLKHFKVVN